MNQSKKKKVAIVGAGPGGLAAAMLMASRGFDVEVFEKAETLGGRSARIEKDGYRFDVGPTFLMMKYLLDEMFLDVGRKTADYLDCRRLEPMYRLQFGDKKLLVTGKREEMKSHIEAIFPGESKKLDAFYEREGKRFEKLYPCLQKEYGRLEAFVSLTLLKAFPHLAAGRSLYDVMAEYFDTEEMRLAFTFQSKYLGMSPWDCPGLFAMIPYTEHAHGVFHVMGGLAEIPQAFAKVAREYGAKIHTSTPVKQVLVSEGQARGLLLEDGREVWADDVVVNADFGHALGRLFPTENLRKWKPKRLKDLKYSCSTFMIHLGLDTTFDIEHHTIFFAKDYQRNLADISEKLCLSEDFSVYVRNASITDPSLAPPGHSSLYVLVPMPNNLSGIDWKKEKNRVRNQVIAFLESKPPFEKLSQHIRTEIVFSPLDWEESNIHLGATFNMGHSLSQLLYFRPHNEFEDFKNCYLVGGGTHPGSGLPTIFESARISTNLLAKKHRLPLIPSKPFREPEAELT